MASDVPGNTNPPEEKPAVDPVAALTAQKDEAEKQAAELKDRLLRLGAEFENYKKRVRREVEEAQHEGREKLLVELLTVMDGLTLALQHAADDNPVSKGVRLVEKQMLGVLEKFGVTRFSAVDQPFDPGLHQAVQHVEAADKPEDTVVGEFACGYMYGSRLFRPAMVSVARAPSPSTDN